MKLPHGIFRHILSFRDTRYEAALSEGAPSAVAIREILEHGPEAEYLGKLASVEHGTYVCWMVNEESAVIFKLRRP